MPAPSPTVFIRNAFLAYQNKILFENINLTLPKESCTALLGPSGVGKTSLLRFIAGLYSPKSVMRGDIQVDNALPIQQQISYMAQTDLLLPWLSAYDNVLLSARLTGRSSKTKIAYAKKLFQQVGLHGAEKKFPHELSGGMRQRVALVRTLAQEKPLVLMDEPFSAVDAITRFQLQTLAAEFLQTRTTLLITHDPLEALRLANDIYILSGQPAKLKHVLSLTSNTPRNTTDLELLKHQATLFHALTDAQETLR